tara:strand:- start:49 stop:507 length:459 start_codon:yes stop_codon:yes gene_type:complete
MSETFKWIYAGKAYNTVDEIQEAVTALKKRLDNNPTDWCVVKPMINPRTISIYSGDVIGYDSGEPLTDEQINALDSSDKVYNVFSIDEGDNYTEVSEELVAQKINALRKGYARWLDVTKYVYIEGEMQGDNFQPTKEAVIYNVTNEDMANYV